MTPEAPVTLLSVWTLGLALGLTACTVTCLPFIGTWALGRAEAGRTSLVDTAAFLAGRLLAYACLGALAGVLGAWFVKELAGGFGNGIIGVSALAAALWLAWPARAHASCAIQRRSASLSPFTMGAALTLIPCAPLATLLATCAASESLSGGAAYGLAFGLGAVITPMIVLVPAAASLGRLLRSHSPWLLPWIRYGAALVLMSLGLRRLLLVSPELALACGAIALLALLWGHVRGSDRGRGRRVIPLMQIPDSLKT